MKPGDEASFTFVEDPAAAHAFWRFVVQLTGRPASAGAPRIVAPDGRTGVEVPPQILDALVKTSYLLAQDEAVLVEAVDGHVSPDDVAGMAMQPIGHIEAAIQRGELPTAADEGGAVSLRDALRYRNTARTIRGEHLADMRAAADAEQRDDGESPTPRA